MSEPLSLFDDVFASGSDSSEKQRAKEIRARRAEREAKHRQDQVRANEVRRAFVRLNPGYALQPGPHGQERLVRMPGIGPAPTPTLGERLNAGFNTVTAPLNKLDAVIGGARAYIGTEGAKRAFWQHVQEWEKHGYTRGRAIELTREYSSDENLLAGFVPGLAADVRKIPVVGGVADFGTSLLTPSTFVTGGLGGLIRKGSKVPRLLKAGERALGVGFGAQAGYGGLQQLQQGIVSDDPNALVKGGLSFVVVGHSAGLGERLLGKKRPSEILFSRSFGDVLKGSTNKPLFESRYKPHSDTVYVNTESMALTAVLGHSRITQIGFTTTPEDIRDLVKKIEAEEHVLAPTKEQLDSIQVFKHHLLQAADHSQGGVAVIYAGSSLPWTFVRDTRRHESVHQGQMAVSPTKHALDHLDLDTVFRLHHHPLYQIARRNLLGAYGYDPREIAAEVPAHINSGWHSSLGLTREQAKELLREYRSVVRAQYGEEALKKIFSKPGAITRELIREEQMHGIPDQEVTTAKRPAAGRRGGRARRKPPGNAYLGLPQADAGNPASDSEFSGLFGSSFHPRVPGFNPGGLISGGLSYGGTDDDRDRRGVRAGLQPDPSIGQNGEADSRWWLEQMLAAPGAAPGSGGESDLSTLLPAGDAISDLFNAAGWQHSGLSIPGGFASMNGDQSRNEDAPGQSFSPLWLDYSSPVGFHDPSTPNFGNLTSYGQGVLLGAAAKQRLARAGLSANGSRLGINVGATGILPGEWSHVPLPGAPALPHSAGRGKQGSWLGTLLSGLSGLGGKPGGPSSPQLEATLKSLVATDQNLIVAVEDLTDVLSGNTPRHGGLGPNGSAGAVGLLGNLNTTLGDLHKTTKQTGSGGSSDPGAVQRRSGAESALGFLGKLKSYAEAGLAATSIYEQARQEGSTFANFVGAVTTGAETGGSLGGPVGAVAGGILGGVLNLFGGGAHRQKPVDPDMNPALYHAPETFDYMAYRYRATGQVPKIPGLEPFKTNAPVVAVHLYVDGVKQSVQTQMANALSGGGYLVSASLDYHRPPD